MCESKPAAALLCTRRRVRRGWGLALPGVTAAAQPGSSAQAAAPEPPAPPSYQEAITGDEEAVLRPIAAVTAGVTGIVDKVQALLVYWEKKYKSIWDQDRDAYMRCARVPRHPAHAGHRVGLG